VRFVAWFSPEDTTSGHNCGGLTFGPERAGSTRRSAWGPETRPSRVRRSCPVPMKLSSHAERYGFDTRNFCRRKRRRRPRSYKPYLAPVKFREIRLSERSLTGCDSRHCAPTPSRQSPWRSSSIVGLAAGGPCGACVGQMSPQRYRMRAPVDASRRSGIRTRKYRTRSGICALYPGTGSAGVENSIDSIAFRLRFP